MPDTTPWFLVSYDIRDPTRLRRIHRLLRSLATPLLESLFLLQCSQARAVQLMQQLKPLLRREDDLWIQRLCSEQPLHRWGRACLPQGVYDLGLPALVEHRDNCIWLPES